MRTVKEPTYKKYITRELKRFDDRNTAFSRGAAEGNKYSKMHQNCLENLKSNKPPGLREQPLTMWFGQIF